MILCVETTITHFALESIVSCDGVFEAYSTSGVCIGTNHWC